MGQVGLILGELVYSMILILDSVLVVFRVAGHF